MNVVTVTCYAGSLVRRLAIILHDDVHVFEYKHCFIHACVCWLACVMLRNFVALNSIEFASSLRFAELSERVQTRLKNTFAEFMTISVVTRQRDDCSVARSRSVRRINKSIAICGSTKLALSVVLVLARHRPAYKCGG